MTGVPCILCSGTDYARDCARGQCHAQQLNLLNDPDPPPERVPPILPPGRHRRGWPDA